jgi:hypothetical protein
VLGIVVAVRKPCMIVDSRHRQSAVDTGMSASTPAATLTWDVGVRNS